MLRKRIVWASLARSYGHHAEPRWACRTFSHGLAHLGLAAQDDISRTRNIGIIAHIDAGKTTTTERMLYYSGYTRRIGNVDEGSTVTDFLPAERARGVTIQSAAISFQWPPVTKDKPTVSRLTADLPPHNINLIDTPGHADFTFEVVRSLRILDGAVCILDAVAGVEAQTEKVWYQAAQYRIPKIIYINKLDRDGAAFGIAVRQIASRLHVWPAVCQIPWWEDGGKGSFCGVGDVVSLRAIRWKSDGDGTEYDIISLVELAKVDQDFATELAKARRALVELLSERDDQMVEKFLEADEDHLAIESSDVIASLRKCVLDSHSTLAPVFAGASFRNIGVQPLLDAVVNFLPSPQEIRDPDIEMAGVQGTLSQLLQGELLRTTMQSSKSLVKHKKPTTALISNLEACALAFKVVHDARKGMLVYVRVYSGLLIARSILYNVNLQISERAPQLLKMYASDSVQVENIPAGQIGVIPGLKHARTGDTLISYLGANTKSGPPAPLNSLELRPIVVPPAVFFSSIEPHSMSEEKNVRAILDLLVREDPSLQITEDEESGQTLLSGMGEFHLEIARDRLVDDFKAKATMGNIEIAYREMLLESSPSNIYVFDKEPGGRQGKASCIAKVEPVPENFALKLDGENDTSFVENGNRITIHVRPSLSPTGSQLWDGEFPSQLSLLIVHGALKNGALAALSRGINYPYQIHDAHVILTLDPIQHLFGAETTPAALSSAARLATKNALKATALTHGSALMELVMTVIVSVNDASLGAVVNDLSSARGGHILSLDDGTVTSGPTVNAAASTTDILPQIDPSKIYTPPDPFGPANPTILTATSSLPEATDSTRQRSITARVPLKEMIGYLKHLRSMTGGRGTFVMSPDRFERVVGQREKILIKEIRGG